jgi:DnaJ-class molecular chaperone
LGCKLSICERCNEVGAHHGLCNRCAGTGSILFPAIACPTCDGSARVRTQECKRCAGIGHLPASATSCRKCNGEGIYSETCQECSGNGQIRLICQECNSSGLIRF